MHLRYTAWLVLTLLTATSAGCNKFIATNPVVSESGPNAQSDAAVQSAAIAQSGPIAQSEAPSAPIAQSRAVLQSGAISQSGAIARSEPPSVPIAQSGAIVQSDPIVQSGPAQSEPPSAPDPSYQNVIADHLKTTFKNYPTYEQFEISAPRWVSSVKGLNWLVCVRFLDRGHRRSYALLFNGSSVVDGHYAYQTDNCGTQTYVVFEQMGGFGLPPLH
jgi:hypothetical protein